MFIFLSQSSWRGINLGQELRARLLKSGQACVLSRGICHISVMHVLRRALAGACACAAGAADTLAILSADQTWREQM